MEDLCERISTLVGLAAMQKVPGVESVRVSLNDGLMILDLKRGNTITLARQARAAYEDLRRRAERGPVLRVEIAGSVEAGAPRLVLRRFKS